MISLIKILNEIQGGPKAIFLAGPAGSGKSYMNRLLLPQDFQTINSDDTYEEMLKASGIGLKQKDFTPDELSQAAKLQAQARKDTQARLEKSMEDRNNIIIDGTGAASGGDWPRAVALRHCRHRAAGPVQRPHGRGRCRGCRR